MDEVNLGWDLGTRKGASEDVAPNTWVWLTSTKYACTTYEDVAVQAARAGPLQLAKGATPPGTRKRCLLKHGNATMNQVMCVVQIVRCGGSNVT